MRGYDARLDRLGLLVPLQWLGDERTERRYHQHDIKVVKTTEDAAQAVEPAKQALDFVTAPMPGFPVSPQVKAP
jgi:hypothetical protein